MLLNKCGKSEGKIYSEILKDLWRYENEKSPPCDEFKDYTNIFQNVFRSFPDTMKFSSWLTHAKQHQCTRDFIHRIF